jgi:hypothetical protein
VKTLTDTLWSLVRWMLPLTAAGVVVALSMGGDRFAGEVRSRAEARLRDIFPALTVRVQAAALVDGEGIVLRGVSLVDPTLPPQHRQLAWIDEVHLACGTALADLAAGPPRITGIRLRRPTLHAVRMADGEWNLVRLVGGRSTSRIVPVSVEEATLLVDDARLHRRITIRHIGVDLRPDAEEVVAIRGNGAGDLFERIAFTGRVQPAAGTFDLAGSIESLEVGPPLHGLAGTATGAAGWLSGLRGRLGVDWRLAGGIDRPDEVALSAVGRLESGHFQHELLPFALSDVRATVRADRSGVVCEDLSAHAGATRVRGSGRTTGWHDGADFDLVVEAERLLVGRHWEGHLPEPLAAQWSKLLPAGEIDLRARLVRRAGTLDPDVAVRCRSVSLTHYRFPYRLDHTVGTAILKEGTLTLHLIGQAGGHPVHVAGSLDTTTDGVPGFVEVRGAGLQIDAALLAAMPPRSADIIRNLRGSGSFDFSFRHERGSRFTGGHDNRLELRLARCSLAYVRFPYPLTNVSGTIRLADGRWEIRDVTGSNDTGVVRCSGVLEPRGDDDGELVLQLTGHGVVLEPELRDALPMGMRRIWDDVDPRGTAEFSATVRHRMQTRRTDVELEAMPEGDSVSIEPAWFPYRLERLRGRVVWRDGQLRFERIRGVHARTTVSTEGVCRFANDGGWHVSFERLAADRFRVDHDLLRALPTGLRDAVAGVGLSGLLSLDGTLDIYTTAGPGPGPGPAAATWDVHLDMEQAALDVGVPLAHVHGGLRLRGQADGTTWQGQGDLDLDSAMVRGVQLTAVQGPLVFDPQGVRFGAGADGPGGAAPRRLSARVADGTLLVDGSVQTGAAGGFAIAASLHDADIGRLTAEATGMPQRYRGRLVGGLELRGSRAGAHSLAGRGSVRLRDADIYELPVVVALLKILRVKAPDRNAFGTSLIDFRIEGPRAYLDNIELAGDAISLVGAGEVDFDGKLQLTFRSIMGDSQMHLPGMKRLLGGASGQFMLVHVDGTISEPMTSTEAFPTLAAAVQKLQARREMPGPTRTASGWQGQGW